MILKQNAQAVTELAILGALVIMAFSFLINYSEKINRQQANIQQTFRAALAEAKKSNNYVAYTKRVYSRLPNVANPMELGQMDSVSDSNNVLWADGKDRDDVYVQTQSPTGIIQWRLVSRYAHPGKEKYQVNDEIKDTSNPANLYDHYGNLLIPPPVVKPPNLIDTVNNLVDATSVLTQKGDSGGLVTKKTLKATDTLTVTILDGKPKTFKHYLGEGGTYSLDGTGISR
jgi:hypothetical protein